MKASLLTRAGPCSLLVVSIIVSLGFLIFKALFDPEVVFVSNDSKASWISAPTNPALIVPKPQEHIFAKEFETRRTNNVFLHVKALRSFTVVVNDQMARQKSASDNWKREESIDLSPYLITGINRLFVYVESREGPALLYAYITGLEKRVATDAKWRIVGKPTPTGMAEVINDIQDPYRDVVRQFRAPSDVLQDMKLPLAVLFGICGLVFMVIRLIPPRWTATLPALLFGVINIIWMFLFVRFIKLPTEIGFDVTGHLEFISYILQKHRLPLANEGWEMFQPPLFYWMSAGIIETFKNVGLNQRILFRIIPFLSSLGNVWVASLLAKKLFRDCPGQNCFTVVMAGLMPMNVYMAAYVSNESLHGFLAGSAIAVTAVILSRDETGWCSVICLAVVSGLALMTKYTMIVVLPVILLFLAIKLVMVEKASLRKAISVLVVFCLTMFGTSGWYYLRNIRHFGRPFVLNLEFWAYWLYPGYHTPKYYLQFGQVFRNPFASGYYSFWDGLYSTFWGDGLWGGMPKPMFWNYDQMALGYWLCVPATVILLLGLTRMAVESLTHQLSTMRSCFSFLSVVVVIVSCWMVYYSGEGASVTVVKSFFGLCLLTPLSIAFGLGMHFIHRSLGKRKLLLPLQVAFYGWYGTFLVFLVAPYLK